METHRIITYALPTLGGVSMFAGIPGLQGNTPLLVLGVVGVFVGFWSAAAHAMASGWYLRFQNGGARACHVDDQQGGFALSLLQYLAVPLICLLIAGIA